MLRLVRQVTLPRLGAVRRFACLRQPGFRAYAMLMKGMRYDAQTLGTKNTVAPFANDLTLVLDGRWIDRRVGERSIAKGQAGLGPSVDHLHDRWDSDVRLLTLEWDEPRLTTHEVRAFSTKVLAAADAWFEVMNDDGPERDSDVPALLRLLDVLRAEGFLVPALVPRTPPEAARRAAGVLNEALLHLDRAPMWVDFTSDRSERQWRRDLTTSKAWLGLVGGSFRSTLNTIRLVYAAALLSIDGVRTSEVAEALGYSSDRALLVALRRSGMNVDVIRRRTASAESVPIVRG